MGGTFDPIHVGHLRAAEIAREAAGLDQVLFLPSHIPPHRPEPAGSPQDRYAMAALATASHPAFLVSDLELRRDGPSYTADTLRILAEERPADERVLIVGSDTFPEMATWRRQDEIFARCRVAVVARPGEGEPPRGDARKPGVLWIEEAGLAVSATLVRARVRQGRSVRYLVPEAVADYIAKKGLYR